MGHRNVPCAHVVCKGGGSTSASLGDKANRVKQEGQVNTDTTILFLKFAWSLELFQKHTRLLCTYYNTKIYLAHSVKKTSYRTLCRLISIMLETYTGTREYTFTANTFIHTNAQKHQSLLRKYS